MQIDSKLRKSSVRKQPSLLWASANWWGEGSCGKSINNNIRWLCKLCWKRNACCVEPALWTPSWV